MLAFGADDQAGRAGRLVEGEQRVDDDLLEVAQG